MTHTKKNLQDVADAALDYGFADHQGARFPRTEPGATATGLAYLRIKPGSEAFAHRHGEAEEIVLMLSGSGRIKLDDELIELVGLDAVRVSPGVTRALEANDEGPRGRRVRSPRRRRRRDGQRLLGA